MKPRHLAVLTAAAAGLAAVACDLATPVVAPHSDAAAGRRSRLVEGVQVLACAPMAADSATVAVGPSGGTITVGPHRLTIPSGALDSTVTITAIVPSDTVNRVELEPTGLGFHTPATLEMSYANCGLTSLLPLHRIAYIDANWDILDVLASLDDVAARRVSAPLHHFSDYAVAW